MKITQDYQSQSIKKVRSNPGDPKSFERAIQSQANKLKHQEIKHLIKEISNQGDKLVRFRSIRDLARFKRLVKGFLEKTVGEGFELNHSHQFSFDGQGRSLSIVKEVDEKLVELTEEIMSQEKKTVDLLGIIGEIKGLLVNLYT